MCGVCVGYMVCTCLCGVCLCECVARIYVCVTVQCVCVCVAFFSSLSCGGVDAHVKDLSVGVIGFYCSQFNWIKSCCRQKGQPADEIGGAAGPEPLPSPSLQSTETLYAGECVCVCVCAHKNKCVCEIHKRQHF